MAQPLPVVHFAGFDGRPAGGANPTRMLTFGPVDLPGRISSSAGAADPGPHAARPDREDWRRVEPANQLEQLGEPGRQPSYLRVLPAPELPSQVQSLLSQAGRVFVLLLRVETSHFADQPVPLRQPRP